MIAILVRHGQSETNVSGFFPDDSRASPRLTEEGVRQAREAGTHIKALGADVIYTSPIPRAVETARLINESLGVELVVDERLREVGLGSLAGRSVAEVMSIRPEWYLDYFTEMNRFGLEKYQDIINRMKGAINDAFSRGHRAAVFVSHLEPIRSMVAYALNAVGPSIRLLKIYNASLTILRVVERDVYEVIAVNWRPSVSYPTS